MTKVSINNTNAPWAALQTSPWVSLMRNHLHSHSSSFSPQPDFSTVPAALSLPLTGGEGASSLRAGLLRLLMSMKRLGLLCCFLLTWLISWRYGQSEGAEERFSGLSQDGLNPTSPRLVQWEACYAYSSCSSPPGQRPQTLPLMTNPSGAFLGGSKGKSRLLKRLERLCSSSCWTIPAPFGFWDSNFAPLTR